MHGKERAGEGRGSDLVYNAVCDLVHVAICDLVHVAICDSGACCCM